MSIVTVGVGQCGCQLAGEFIASTFNNLSALHNANTPAHNESVYSSVLGDFLYKFTMPTEKDHHVIEPRALLVDAEPRVAECTITTLQKRFSSPSDLRLQWPSKHGSVISANKTGSGNNFASGAFLVWPRLAEQSLNSIRRIIEKCDRCRGCLLFMSLGGGTGSGVGSTLTQHFADSFPDVPLLTSGVLPHISGEASTQTYNCLLSLSTLAEYSDACVLLSNDAIAAHCSPISVGTSVTSLNRHHHNTTSFAEMNAHIADELLSLLLPSRCAPTLVDAAVPALSSPLNSSMLSNVDDMFIDTLVRQVAFHPDYKLLLLDKVPAIKPRPLLSVDAPDSSANDLMAYSLVAEATWKSLLRSLSVQSRARECPADVAERLPSPIFVLRSAGLTASRRTSSQIVDANAADTVPADAMTPWQQIIRRATPGESPFFRGLTPPAHGIHRSITLLGPSHRVSDLITPILTRTKSLLPKRAFLHLYEKYGVDSSYFEQSLCILERLNHCYSSRF